MRKLFLLAITLICLQFAMAQGWNQRLVSSSENEIKVEINVDGYVKNAVVTPQGDAFVVTNNKMMQLAQAGEPNVPSFVIPAIIGDNALMSVEVVDAQYVDYENIVVAPSKGDFPRSINPDDVPYTYGAMYQQDAFFPNEIAKLDEPYIHRDVRGQNMIVTPYLYNAVTKTLRVYTHFTLKMVKVGVDNRNIVENRSKSISIDPEFNKIYESRYINYAESMNRYTAIGENGELLIICHDAFMTAMEPFVAWKKQIGRPTTMVGTSVTGNTASAIQSYLATYYASHPNLTDILLVGDVAQIPGVYISAGSGNQNYSGYGDLQYGQLAGNDYYNEVIVGRFCCETVDQVTNHVNKVLNYERDLDETATWLTVGEGVSKNEGAGGGHYGEADYQHIDLVRDDLLDYNYTEVHRDYQGVTGVTASAATVSQHINEGVSIINYCNHGNITLWGVFSYSNSHVNALTNDYKLPYIISVACLNGKYDHSGPCFAEAWMRATNNSTGNPTGAIGGMFSYISQPWQPPMYGQDEMIDILVESKSNNIKRTMGGVSIDGNMRVLDLGANQNANKGTYNNWILFGDPTLTLRNAVPANMGVSCDNSMARTQTTFVVNATNGDGALATLTFNGEILGSAEIVNGSAEISFEAPNTTGTATLTVFGYNKKTYTKAIEITDGGMTPLLVIAFAEPETIEIGESVTLTANASGGTGNYTYEWTPSETVADPTASTTTATPTETGIIVYMVTVDDGTSTASADVMVTVNEPQPVTCPTPSHFMGRNYYEGGEFGAHLAWDKVNYEYDLDRFEVYRSDNDLDYKLVKRIVNTPSINHYECDDAVDEAGLYFYRIKAFYQNDCESDYVQIEVEVIDYTEVNEDLTNNVMVYPNPTSGMVNIKAEAMQQVSVVNMMGQVVMTQNVDADEVMIDMSTFENGMYLINIMTENGNVLKRINVLR
ncbi:MAG: T9SS type A sorting domain-containing protein [Bacteroidales bacterium]|nr:T9SS type A sorting domain-containing protein [Bacteroidales bacterium]